MKLLRYFYAVLIVMAFTMPADANPYSSLSNKTSKFIKYNFSYHTDNEKNSILQVGLSFRGDSSGKTTLVLPFQIAEINDLYKNIENLHAVNARIEKTIDPKIYLLHYAPDDIIFITYQVKQGWQGPPVLQQFLAPIFQKNYFQFPGEGVFVYPESYKDEKDISVTFNCQMPSKWMIADSYGTNITHQHIRTNLNSILRGLYIGGDFRLYQTPVKDGIVWTAIQGKWQFKDEEFNTTMVKIVSGGRSFWNDNSPHYLATLLPIGTGCKSGGGTGHTNSFSAFFNENCTLTNNNILHILSHENFHNWDNHENFFGELDKKREVYNYWFSEVFTDYYASLLNLRSGLLDFEGYIKRYNKVIVDYYSSPVNSATIEQIAENIWQNFDMERLVYQQGEILAHNWDTQIKLETKQQSLDDLMRALLNSVKTEKSKLTLDKMSQIAGQYHKNDVLQDVNSLYSRRILIPNPNSLGPCVYQTTKMLAPYSRCFDIDVSKEAGIITSVKPDSRAFAAGLRDGQQLIAVEEHPDDISQTMNITIKDNGLIKVIKYYPYKGDLKAIPQFILDQSMWKAETDKC